MKLKMASDNICFFIIEYYSFDKIVDFVLMPSNQILCTMVVNILLIHRECRRLYSQMSHSHESLGNAGGSGKNCGSQSELNLNCDDGPGILDGKY